MVGRKTAARTLILSGLFSLLAAPALAEGRQEANQANLASRQDLQTGVVDSALDKARELASKENMEDEASAPYRLVPGSLARQLEEWCSQAGYVLAWKAGRDIEVETQTCFEGGFVEALRSLFRRLADSGHSFRVNVYTANTVVEVLGE